MSVITLLRIHGTKWVAVIGGVEVSAKTEEDARQKALDLIFSDPLVVEEEKKRRYKDAYGASS